MKGIKDLSLKELRKTLREAIQDRVKLKAQQAEGKGTGEGFRIVEDSIKDLLDEVTRRNKP